MISSRTRLAPLAGAALVLLFASTTDLAAQTPPEPAPVAQTAPAPAPQFFSAWTDRIFVNASLGQQWMNQQLRTSGSIENVFEETATWESSFDVDDSPLFDIAGGFRIWKNLAIGAGFTRTSDTHTSSFTASIPDTVEFDRPHLDTRTIEGLEREETIIHLSAIWMVPITDRIDIALSGGPSFFNVKQDFVAGMTVSPTESKIATVTTSSFEKSVTGFHIAADGTVRVVRNAGIGFLIRYATAKLDTPELLGGTIDVGGFQGLAGVRIRF